MHETHASTATAVADTPNDTLPAGGPRLYAERTRAR